MNGLILHCGASRIERHELMAMPEPKAQGERHQPVHHGDYVEMVDAALKDAGLTVAEEAFGVTREGARFFGMMRITGPSIVDGGDEYGFTLGLRGSHDRSLDRSLAAGGHVFVCDNLAFSGDHRVGTRQTTNVLDRLPEMIRGLIFEAGGWSERLAEQYDSYKRKMLTAEKADALLTGMVRRGVVVPSEMGRLIDAWDSPPHAEFEEPNVWRAFNAATEVLKPRNPETPRIATLAPKTVKLHELCDEFVTVH